MDKTLKAQLDELRMLVSKIVAEDHARQMKKLQAYRDYYGHDSWFGYLAADIRCHMGMPLPSTSSAEAPSFDPMAAYVESGRT